MDFVLSKSQLTLAVVAALGAAAAVTGSHVANAAKTAGTYVAGDFHNHTTCSDGSTSMQKLVSKSTNPADIPWALDWFVQAGHGGRGTRNCTLVEDDTLSTPAYPFIPGRSPQTTWAASIGAAAVKGNDSTTTMAGPPLSTLANPNMWRWQSVQEFQYPLIEYLNAYLDRPLFIGIETVVPGHEHTSMAIITGQIPVELDNYPLPGSPPYTPLGNANALSQWEYCFDRADTDWSRGNTQVGSGVGNNWECSVPNSPNSTDPALGFNPTAQKIFPTAPVGTNGHLKTIEALKWMVAFHPNGSYYVPAHLERAGPFNPVGNNGFNVEHLRNMHNVAPRVAFGFETQPGHGASEQRGEYTLRRNTIGGVNVDSVGGTTYGGTGVYGAQVGGVWDALLGEGRGWYFFASSDWHSRGDFGSDDRRSSNDFWPGEYQRNYTLVRNGDDKLRPNTIVDGLRTGNTFVATGQLVDRMAFIACASYPGPAARTNAAVENLAVNAALKNTDIDVPNCATMGEKLVVRPGADIVVSIVVRDPDSANYSPYSFNNPSLAQIGMAQPLDRPVLDHIDVIRGLVTGYKTPGAPDYAGEWPRDWVFNPNLANVPAAAKNTSATLLRTFNAATWTTVPGNSEFKKMTFRIPAVTASQYIRVRGTNLPPNVPYETDTAGNPVTDLWTNSQQVRAVTGGAIEFPFGYFLRIPCTVTGTNIPDNSVTYSGTGIDGCPNHMPVKDGQKFMAGDVAAWADLWLYSNPIFIQVGGSSIVALQ